MPKKPDRLFFFVTIGLALFGFFIFSSAALGLLNRNGADYDLIVSKQAAILGGGLLLFFIVSRLNFRLWQALGPWLFGLGVLLSVLVLIPGIGVEFNGARRWLEIAGFSIQPSEFLKLGFILYLAAWFAKVRQGVQTVRRGLLPFLLGSAIASILLIAEPDIDTLVIILAGGLGIYFAAGAPWKHLLVIGALILITIGAVSLYKPYIVARVRTFLDPNQNALGASYQINQSLIAIGSGRLAGRGFGQSIQKFKYLPEPMGDSVFSVASEEFGFLGATFLILLFLTFALAGFKIAIRSHNLFGRLAVVGIVIMIMTGVAINIASMLGLIPLTGTPLLFISHGGTALLFTLAEAGIIANISRYRAKL